MGNHLAKQGLLLGVLAACGLAAWLAGQGRAQEAPGAAAAAPASAPAAPGGWYQWRGPARDGVSTEKDWSPTFPQGGPKIAWKASVGAGFSAVTVSSGRAYTMGNADGKDTVWCFDADKGTEIWKYSYPCQSPKEHPGPRCSPATDGEFVFTLSRTGNLFCLDAAKGRVVWSKHVSKDFGARPGDWGFAGSPLIYGDWVIVDAGVVVALKRATGEPAWKSQAYPCGYSSAMPFALGNQHGLAVFNAGGLVILNAADGKELAKFPWKTEYDVNAVTPIVADNKVFISSGYEVGCALLDLAKPLKVVWQNKEMRNHYTSCVLVDGFLYGFDEGEVKCLDFKTGQARWKQGGLGKGSLMAADGKLILISADGELVTAEASPKGFKAISRARVLPETCWTMPVLSGGKIYCRNDGGSLVAVDVSAKKE